MKKCEKGFFKACSKFIGKAAKIGANDRCYGLHYQPKKPAALKNNPATQSKAVQASVCTAFCCPPVMEKQQQPFLSPVRALSFTLISRFRQHIPKSRRNKHK